jgi:tRNA G18 (ribose-2'-O)-methylase SpoU
MVSRQHTNKREERYRTAMKRYQKDRQRNVLAKPGAHQFILVLDHLQAGFNVPKIFRTAETLGAHEIHLVNVGPFDPAPAKGTFRKVPAKFHESIAECFEQLKERGYSLFTLEAEKGSVLYEAELPEKSAFILGNEDNGISFNYSEYPEVKCLSIPNFGVTESLNVSIAASIAMYEYISQHRIKTIKPTTDQ